MRSSNTTSLLRLLCTVAGAWCITAAAPAWAVAPLMIWPIDPVILGDQRAAAVWVENHGTEPLSIQVRVLDWQQPEGVERLGPQQQVVASPPITSIPPGQRQMVRLIATQPALPGAERAYRVLVDELPSTDPASDAAPGGAAVKLQMRYSLPLFVYGKGVRPDKELATNTERKQPEPARLLRPQIAWSITRAEGKPMLNIRNLGEAHARITGVEWVADGQAPVAVNQGLLGYVLPQVRMRWPLDREPPAGYTLKAVVNGTSMPLQRE